jgi:Epoxide hydrolase N terminus
VFAAELVSRGVRDRTGLARPGNAFANTGPAITPFTYHAPPSALDDLKRRLAQTRWPERETVADWSQGVPLKKMKALVEYWRTDYDWRRCEARLNGLGQYRMPFVFPDPIPTAGLSAAEQRAVDAFKRFQTDGFGYFLQQC